MKPGRDRGQFDDSTQLATLPGPRARARPELELAILFLARDAEARRLYGLKFRLDGYLVMHQGDGESVESSIAELNPDLVFADARPPGAWETIQQVRAAKTNPGIPLLILSNHPRREMAQRGFLLRPNEYVLMTAQTGAESQIA